MPYGSRGGVLAGVPPQLGNCSSRSAQQQTAAAAEDGQRAAQLVMLQASGHGLQL